MTEMTDMTESTGATEMTDRTTAARIEGAGALEPGSMRMAKVGERRVAVIRTASGLYALDNACPHQGYGLVTGSLDGELLTCQWHNWKFDARTGVCVMGEEDVPCHRIEQDGDDAIVWVTEPSNEERREQLWPSLRRGIERHAVGQLSRDVARLLQAQATPDQIVAEALSLGLPRTEWGMGHEMAVTADLLQLTDTRADLDRTLPLAHALAGIAEMSRDRPEHAAPESVDAAGDRGTFLDAVESEDWSRSVVAIRGFIAAGGDLAEVRSWFIEAVSQHHLGYGHGAIYTQKAFTLIERLPELTDLLLTELALTIINDTREDTLPYMRKVMREISEVDLDALASTASHEETGWVDQDGRLLQQLLDAGEVPVAELVEAAHAGAGVAGLINIVSLAGARRLLEFDVNVDQRQDAPFGWLDITHVVTYANAARWAWSVDPGPHTARLVLLTAFLAFDSGRGLRQYEYSLSRIPDPAEGDLASSVAAGRVDEAVAAALAGDSSEVSDILEQASMELSGGSFIVSAHMVKLAVAARSEAVATGSMLPLAAAARFLTAPRTARFVAGAVAEAVDFVRTGKPPAR